MKDDNLVIVVGKDMGMGDYIRLEVNRNEKPIRITKKNKNLRFSRENISDGNLWLCTDIVSGITYIGKDGRMACPVELIIFLEDGNYKDIGLSYIFKGFNGDGKSEVISKNAKLSN